MKKRFKAILSLSFILSLVLVFNKSVLASDEDFVIDTKTEVSYTTGDDYVIVKTEYIRNVKIIAFTFPLVVKKYFTYQMSQVALKRILKKKENTN
jgi:hypothetical protein